MSRAPFVMPKSESAFSRGNAKYDTTIGWRFVNALTKAQYGLDAMPETAENVATADGIERMAQDRMTLASRLKAVAAQKAGQPASEITPVTIPQKKGDPAVVTRDDPPPALLLADEAAAVRHALTPRARGVAWPPSARRLRRANG